MNLVLYITVPSKMNCRVLHSKTQQFILLGTVFQVSGKAVTFCLVKPGHLPNFSPICLFLGGTFKIVIDIAKKKVQTFLTVQCLGGSYGPPPI